MNHSYQARKISLFLVFLVCSLLVRSQPKLQILMNTDKQSVSFGNVTVAGWDDTNLNELENISSSDWKNILEIFTGDNPAIDQPSVLGKYKFVNKTLVYEPRFPPVPGLTYTIRLDSQLLNKQLSDGTIYGDQPSQTFTILPEDLIPVRVTGIFPQEDTIPSNLLRLYIVFDRPMSFQNPYDFIKLKDSDGKNLLEPFVEVSEGLWDTERKRLTLIIHPGRIKRGVGPNLIMGSVLEENKTYSLFIDPEWKDASGIPIGNQMEKRFFTREPVREKVKILACNYSSIKADTRIPLIINFNHSMDTYLLSRMISLKHNVKGPVSSSIMDQNGSYILSPKGNWSSGTYTLSISSKLEDISGNTMNYVFDTELENNNSIQKNYKDYILEFTID